VIFGCTTKFPPLACFFVAGTPDPSFCFCDLKKLVIRGPLALFACSFTFRFIALNDFFLAYPSSFSALKVVRALDYGLISSMRAS